MMKLKEIWFLLLGWFGLYTKLDPNRNDKLIKALSLQPRGMFSPQWSNTPVPCENGNVPDLSHCFTLMELFEYLCQTEDKPYIEKLIVVTVSGKLNVFFHQDKTIEDYMQFISSIKEPIELIIEYADEHPNSSHWTYRRITDLYFYPAIHFKTSEVV